MKKYIFLFGFIIALSFFIFIIIYKKNPFVSNKSSYTIYDSFSEKWKPAKDEPVGVAIGDDNNDNSDGFHNNSILRGYFDHYDEKTNRLYIKSAVPFGMEQLFEIKAVNVGLKQSFYCSPLQMVDEKTGETIPMRAARFPVYDGQTLYTYYEKIISFDKFLSNANERTWIFLQLTSPYSEKQENYLYKLVAAGLCE